MQRAALRGLGGLILAAAVVIAVAIPTELPRRIATYPSGPGADSHVILRIAIILVGVIVAAVVFMASRRRTI